MKIYSVNNNIKQSKSFLLPNTIVKFLAIALAAAVKLESGFVETQTPGVEDALVQLGAPCVYLDETQAELDYQVDMFSRTLDPRHWTNAQNIAKEMTDAGKKPKMYVHTWELFDKAFSFPRVRRYAFVQENMDMLEHF